LKPQNRVVTFLFFISVFLSVSCETNFRNTAGISTKHLVVFSNNNKFAGWPANNGVWSWNGQEILVGFTLGDFEEKDGHNIGEKRQSVLARSLDGGETWKLEDPDNFVGDISSRRLLTEPINFKDPDFALRIEGTGYHGSDDSLGSFFYSMDRGRSWRGPYILNTLNEVTELTGLEFTPRTDYLIEDSQKCLIFMSVRKPGVFGSDRLFCARTTDGGLTFQFISWVVPPSDPYRAVMPASVRCSHHKLVTVVRRREIGTDRCWIDCLTSQDNGDNWSFSGKVGNTGPENGNPPALVRLTDGRLCCLYGNREKRQLIARFSGDEGLTWDDDIILRDDFFPDSFNDGDLGYPRGILREDGKLLAIYYWASQEQKQQYIAATLFDAPGND